MRVAFFTESNFVGKVPRDFRNCRTEYAWYIALNADHYPINYDNLTDGYDLGIIIIPKKNPTFDFSNIRRMCKKVAIMQEGPSWFWQDWDIPTQINYINALRSADILYVHNESDIKYYTGLVNHPDVRLMPSLMIEDSIDKKSLCLPHDRSGVMIGGNFVSWYGGFDSYSIAGEFNEPIYAPSMGRKPEMENDLDEIIHLPYLLWNDWITALSYRKYGVHLMRTHAAGTFALNCAYLGIPCIGYKGLDTQEICHPHLTVEVGDLAHARKVAKHLNNNRQFYESCSVVARENYKEYFREKVFIEKFYQEVK